MGVKSYLGSCHPSALSLLRLVAVSLLFEGSIAYKGSSAGVVALTGPLAGGGEP